MNGGRGMLIRKSMHMFLKETLLNIHQSTFSSLWLLGPEEDEISPPFVVRLKPPDWVLASGPTEWHFQAAKSPASSAMYFCSPSEGSKVLININYLILPLFHASVVRVSPTFAFICWFYLVILTPRSYYPRSVLPSFRERLLSGWGSFAMRKCWMALWSLRTRIGLRDSLA